MMSEVWSSSSVLVSEVKFNWKMNDFFPMFNRPRPITGFSGDSRITREMSSPSFKIGSDTCWLYIAQISETDNLTIDGVVANAEDYGVIKIVAKSSKADILVGGSLTMDMEGASFFGLMGDSTLKTVQIDHTFKNQTSKIGFKKAYNFESYFCVSRLVTKIEMKAKIYFRSPVTNTIGHEPVTDTGLLKLSADMRALLNRAAECSDFNIECGGKTFPCHEIILRARSTVLDAMFQNDMTENSGRSMKVVDVGPKTMAGVLEYMYTGGITSEVENMSELIYIADKYDMEGLLEMCFKKLYEISDDEIGDVLFIAHKHNFAEFKKAIMIRIIMNKSKFVEDQDFMEKLKSVPDLLLELFKL